MGFAALALIAAGVAGLLWWLKLPRLVWSFAGSAMMLGAAGYVLQGRPMLPDHPVTADSAPIEIDPGILRLRDQMAGRFAPEAPFITASDALTRSGDPAAAAKLLIGAIGHAPNSATLWTELGNAYVAHDGTMSPAATFSFARARELAPDSPAPWFFTGLGYVRAAQFAQARPYWQRALALTPADAEYRPAMVVRLKLLDQFLAMAGVDGGAGAP